MLRSNNSYPVIPEIRRIDVSQKCCPNLRQASVSIWIRREGRKTIERRRKKGEGEEAERNRERKIPKTKGGSGEREIWSDVREVDEREGEVSEERIKRNKGESKQSWNHERRE
jgi:hypothetical protein